MTNENPDPHVDDDHNSSSDDGMGTETSTSAIEESPKAQAEVQMAASETKRIRILRIILIFGSIMLGVVVTTLLYVWLKNDNAEESQAAFHFFADGVHDTFKFHMGDFIYKNNALRRAISSSALEHGGTFPFFAIPNFEVKAFGMRNEALFETVAFAPAVSLAQLDQYLIFANETRGWLVESKKIYDELEPGKNRSGEPFPFPYPETLLCIDHAQDRLHYSKVLTAPCAVYKDLYLPLLHISPPPLVNETFNNIEMLSDHTYREIVPAARAVQNVVFSKIDLDPHAFDFVFGSEIHSNSHTHPHTLSAIPVYDDIVPTDNVVGFAFGVIAWDKYMTGLVPQGVEGVVLVLRNSCGQHFTFQLHGPEVEYLGEGDLHDPKYDAQKVVVDLAENYPDQDLLKNTQGHCYVFLDVYPSDTFYEAYASSVALIFAVVAACVFAFKNALFGLYDLYVQKRNHKVTSAAVRSNAIVSSMFPEAVMERLVAEKENKTQKKVKGFENSQDEKDENGMFKSKPIADLYPEATVLFADIVGFTAWSSVREPSQVFVLLETLYSAFDKIADQRRIYKVETIGDCYVAVCGLPQPRKDHAVAMARFARDCMYKMWALTRTLEATLGPDTGDLTLRMGLHSGPVTAGVLRGERSRFQLFGDTMNIASRMESTGQPSCIQISQATADLLSEAGKSKWIKAGENLVCTKSKGETTKAFFLDIRHSQGSASVYSSEDGTSHSKDQMLLPGDDNTFEKNSRQIDWTFEILSRLLKQIIASRETSLMSSAQSKDETLVSDVNPFDQVKEIIEMPSQQNSLTAIEDIDSVQLNAEVANQLRSLLQKIASKYRENPFHNFEHASHVTMSVTKLLSRIIAPSHLDCSCDVRKMNAKSLHDHTYGITSCPLTQFAVVFSAIIHDMDHPGVPNAQLVKEKTKLAELYNNVSVAEQNSVDLAFDLLSGDEYRELRHTIAATKEELSRFRQLVINVVMATDICDKQLKELRNNRWNRAFCIESQKEESEEQARNRKATIVIEHLIQASDIAHTMQHWHIYRKWNERFFMECYAAYKTGRAETDPSTNWYKGEIGFFDFYIIPLARKLKECGVFGVSSNEYLDYAEKNRQEWVDRGEEVVSEMIERAREHWNQSSDVKDLME